MVAPLGTKLTIVYSSKIRDELHKQLIVNLPAMLVLVTSVTAEDSSAGITGAQHPTWNVCEPTVKVTLFCHQPIERTTAIHLKFFRINFVNKGLAKRAQNLILPCFSLQSAISTAMFILFYVIN